MCQSNKQGPAVDLSTYIVVEPHGEGELQQ